MLAIVCCILDSRGNQHEQLIESARRNCLAADTLIYTKHQDLPTVERYALAYEHFRDSKYTHYMFGASDIVLATGDFDIQVAAITNQAEKKSGHRVFVLYPDDGIHGIRLCSHPVFTREFLEATGEFFPRGYMKHCYVDNYIMNITKKTNTLLFCPDLKIIHNHPLSTGGTRGVMDEHYAKVYDRNFQNNDRMMFDKCITEHAPAVLKKIEAGKKTQSRRAIRSDAPWESPLKAGPGKKKYRFIYYRRWKQWRDFGKLFIALWQSVKYKYDKRGAPG